MSTDCLQHGRRLLHHGVPVHTAGTARTGTTAGRGRRLLVVPSATVAVAVLLYFGIRAGHDPVTAARHSGAWAAGERELLRWWELCRRGPTTADRALTRTSAAVSLVGHWPVVVLALAWLVRRNHTVYARVGGAMLLSAAAGIVFFMVSLATSSPLVASLAGTAATGQAGGSGTPRPDTFAGWYAGAPGIRLGLSLLVTLAVFSVTRSAWLRVAAVAMTVSMGAAAVLSVDRHPLNAVVGVALATVSWLVAGQLQTDRPHPEAAAEEDRPQPEPLRTTPAPGTAAPGATTPRIVPLPTRDPRPAFRPESVPLHRVS